MRLGQATSWVFQARAKPGRSLSGLANRLSLPAPPQFRLQDAVQVPRSRPEPLKVTPDTRSG